MTPTGKEARARFALKALHDDATEWSRAANELSDAARAAARLDLSAHHLSHLADAAGLTGKYREIQDGLVRLLGEGAANFDSLATALRAAADAYAKTDDFSRRTLRNDGKN